MGLIEVLRRIETEFLPKALKNLDGWEGLLIDYEEPNVYRLRRDFEDYRVYLHRILHCDKAYFHPHPWPCAVRIIQGVYRMEMGYGTPDLNKVPDVSSVLYLEENCLYEMTDPNLWHSVKPTGFDQSISVMVTGKPWKTGKQPKAVNHNSKPLPTGAAEMLLQTCYHSYSNGRVF